MGYAAIVSGGTNGRYVIRIDSGEGTRLSIINAVTTRINQLELRVLQAQIKVDEFEALDAAFIASLEQLANNYPPPTQGGPQQAANIVMTGVRKQLTASRFKALPYRVELGALKFDLAQARKLAARMNTVATIRTKPAWCVDFTETIAPGTFVATCDIPGDSNLQLIAPGGRSWTPADGQLTERELCSPAQAYFNAAIFPGWQKFKPTYRWGTLTAVNKTANTASVSLFAQTSSARRLSVNQTSTLNNVTVEYMTCGAQVFEVGDRVIVQFLGQDWSQPRVIGFLDNPRPCDLECFAVQSTSYFFRVRAVTLMNALFGGAVTFEAKVNGVSSWVTVPSDFETGSIISRKLRIPYGTTFAAETLYRDVFIVISRYGNTTNPLQTDYGAPPYISITNSPHLVGSPPDLTYIEGVPGPLGTFLTPAANIAEVRIKIAGILVFNVAVTDMGFAPQRVSGYVKTNTGIRLYPYISVPRLCAPLPGYTLTGDS